MQSDPAMLNSSGDTCDADNAGDDCRWWHDVVEGYYYAPSTVGCIKLWYDPPVSVHGLLSYDREITCTISKKYTSDKFNSSVYIQVYIPYLAKMKITTLVVKEHLFENKQLNYTLVVYDSFLHSWEAHKKYSKGCPFARMHVVMISPFCLLPHQ